MASRLIRLCAGLLLIAAAHAACSAPVPAPVQAGIADGRAEFRALFCGLLRRDRALDGADCHGWLRRFPDEAALAPKRPSFDAGPAANIVIVGGLFSDCLPTVPAFGDAVEPLRAMGYRVSHAPIKGRASAEANAAIIRAHVVQESAAMPNLPILIVAYSKGVSDTMTALATFPELGEKVGALISVAGVVNGSHAADQFLKIYDATAGLVPYSACPVGDGGEVRTLTHEYRRNWLATHLLPAGPLYFSIVALPAPERVSAVLSVFHRSLSRTDPRNDGQMIYADAILPRSALLGYANADHLAIALPFDSAMPNARLVGINRNDYPRAQLVEAAIRLAQARFAAGRRQ
ncbi:MAG: hypothetical protein JWQ01_1505 [Massilia sp.]|jgi:hypothetical protein|nr:hypothetical protein [Massilia sp.]